MGVLAWLRREYSLPRWLNPPPWLRKVGRFVWVCLSCLFGIGLAVFAVPAPFGGLLLALFSSVSLTRKKPRVWLDFFVLEGRGAKFFDVTWLLAGLVLCIKHYI